MSYSDRDKNFPVRIVLKGLHDKTSNLFFMYRVMYKVFVKRHRIIVAIDFEVKTTRKIEQNDVCLRLRFDLIKKDQI